MSDTINAIDAPSMPEWVTETPEHEEGRFYGLNTDIHGDEDQNIGDLTREEFVWLKARLAQRRGLVGASLEDEESAKPGLKSMATAASDTVLLTQMRLVTGIIEGQVRMALACREKRPDLQTKVFADVALLNSIFADWEGQYFKDDFPGELGLVAAIRGNLGL